MILFSGYLWHENIGHIFIQPYHNKILSAQIQMLKKAFDRLF